MATEHNMLSIEQVKDELSQIYNQHIAIRISVKLGLHPIFSSKQQLFAIWDEHNACNDISVSIKICELLFGIKKSRFNEIIHKRNRIQRDIPNQRKFDDPQEASDAHLWTCFFDVLITLWIRDGANLENMAAKKSNVKIWIDIKQRSINTYSGTQLAAFLPLTNLAARIDQMQNHK
ncbi:MAG: hypothetical protein EZS28_033761 [Streblomastix strix]|uniref:Uncharacterized protein n=1 Tax=Streblomastix strix TaxID=222440 RepID=A0A5J4UKH1_9EUKA|nr:MAG: hypothetical protein EZS28_033761 [Streblomastix strix]